MLPQEFMCMDLTTRNFSSPRLNYYNEMPDLQKIKPSSTHDLTLHLESSISHHG
jgi:hypothetical protein